MRAAGFSLALVATLGAATALSAGAATTSDSYQRAFLTVRVNGSDIGTFLVLIGSGDVLLDSETIAQTGIVPNRLPVARSVEGAQRISLRDFGSVLAFKVDQVGLALEITVQPELLSGSKLDVGGSGNGLAVAPPLRSTFLNYSVERSGGRSRLAQELGSAIGNGDLDIAVAESDRLQVYGASLLFDDPLKIRRFVIGTTAANEDDFSGLGGDARVAGLSYTAGNTSAFGSTVSSPYGISGIAATPSTAQIYVNGSLVREEPLPPGPFDIGNLPYQPGNNAATVVIRDAFGRVQTLHRSAFVSGDLLAAGARTFALVAGADLDDVTGDSRGRPLTVATAAEGFTSTLTMAERIELSAPVSNAGLSFVTGSPIGQFEFSANASTSIAEKPSRAFDVPLLGASDDQTVVPPPVPIGSRVWGSAFAVDYNGSFGRVQTALDARLQTPYYGTLSRPALAERALSDFRAAVAAPAGRHRSLSCQVEAVRYRDEGAANEETCGIGTGLGRLLNLSVAAGHRVAAGSGGLVLDLTIAASLPGNGQAIATQQTRDGVETREFDVHHVAPDSVGLSYGVQVISQVDVGPSDSVAAQRQVAVDATYDTHDGTVRFDRTTIAGRSENDLEADGAIVFAGGSTFLTKPVEGSFAVVQVDDVAGVHVDVNNQAVGETNAKGQVLAPTLFAYRKNTVKIAAEDAPLDVIVDQTVQSTVPRYRSGALARFHTRKVRAFTGYVRLGSAAGTIPSFGRLTLRSGTLVFESDIGGDGAFYFDSPAAGTYAATIAYAAGTCSFSMTIPAESEPLTALGTLVCPRKSGLDARARHP